YHTLHEFVAILEAANTTLFQRGKGSFLLTTLSAALKIGETLHIVSVGDSPGYLIREGEIVGLTTATGNPSLFGIANALGRRARLSYTAQELTLQPRDRVVLVTDGILDNIAPAELAVLAQRAASPQEAVTQLQDLLAARKRTNLGRRDDYSGFRSDDATASIRFIDERVVTSG
ncbi:MAG: PP2C family protein-serine/threonine phosphatase, partial [Candidatus Entotheonellia bacterium]